jgi:hypothetical protein
MPDAIEDLVRIYVGATPRDVFSTSLGEDIAYTLAEMFALAYTEIQRLAAGSNVGTAVGAFLDLHARDRGLRRQEGETDEQLRERLRKPPQAGTVPAIHEAISAIIGDASKVIIIELPRSSGYYDQKCFYDSGSRMGGGRGVVIVLIPLESDAKAAVMDAVRTKVSAGKIWLVEEYT